MTEDSTVEAAALAKAQRKQKQGRQALGRSGKYEEEAGSDEEAEESAAGPSYIPSAVSKRILLEARAQQKEMDEEAEAAGGSKVRFALGGAGGKGKRGKTISLGGKKGRKEEEDLDSSDEEEEEEEDEAVEFGAEDGEEGRGGRCDCMDSSLL